MGWGSGGTWNRQSLTPTGKIKNMGTPLERSYMKPADKKRDYIRLRAEGLSYDSIAKELGISKSTCSAWAEELKEEVEELRSQELQELYTEYSMSQAERIRSLG